MSAVSQPTFVASGAQPESLSAQSISELGDQWASRCSQSSCGGTTSIETSFVSMPSSFDVFPPSVGRPNNRLRHKPGKRIRLVIQRYQWQKIKYPSEPEEHYFNATGERLDETIEQTQR
jgi:hypothetical protein